jgi:hypothetical protein
MNSIDNEMAGLFARIKQLEEQKAKQDEKVTIPKAEYEMLLDKSKKFDDLERIVAQMNGILGSPKAPQAAARSPIPSITGGYTANPVQQITTQATLFATGQNALMGNSKTTKKTVPLPTDLSGVQAFVAYYKEKYDNKAYMGVDKNRTIGLNLCSKQMKNITTAEFRGLPGAGCVTYNLPFEPFIFNIAYEKASLQRDPSIVRAFDVLREVELRGSGIQTTPQNGFQGTMNSSSFQQPLFPPMSYSPPPTQTFQNGTTTPKKTTMDMEEFEKLLDITVAKKMAAAELEKKNEPDAENPETPDLNAFGLENGRKYESSDVEPDDGGDKIKIDPNVINNEL